MTVHLGLTGFSASLEPYSLFHSAIQVKTKTVEARMKKEAWGERPCPEEAQGPRLQPGPDGWPVSKRLVAGSATEPSWAQPE